MNYFLQVSRESLSNPVPQSTRNTRRPPAYRLSTACVLLGLLAACSDLPVVDLPSENQSDRIDYIVIHFTSEDFAESVRLLTTRTDNPVSSHYLLPLVGDPTYLRKYPEIFRLVPENRRAWHAGRSNWAGEENLNDRSIGIEIVNLSRCVAGPDEDYFYPIETICNFKPFPEAQIEQLMGLLADLLDRYPGIDPVDVIGHSDIAPNRKYDPGPLFPWKKLYDAGIGAWPDEDSVRHWRSQFEGDVPSVGTVQQALSGYGYAVEETGEEDRQTREALRAFQMHFVPSRVTGSRDAETAATLFALLEKYRPEALAELRRSETADRHP